MGGSAVNIKNHNYSFRLRNNNIHHRHHNNHDHNNYDNHSDSDSDNDSSNNNSNNNLYRGAKPFSNVVVFSIVQASSPHSAGEFHKGPWRLDRTHSQLSRPIPWGHHIFMEYRLRRILYVLTPNKVYGNLIIRKNKKRHPKVWRWCILLRNYTMTTKDPKVWRWCILRRWREYIMYGHALYYGENIP